MNYGIPYMGSKSKIVNDICPIFPSADHFYDLFGGGFSVSHFMIQHRSKHFKEFHFNEIRPGMTELIQKAISGEFAYNRFKPGWISREEFFREKENDLYIKVCWSFGNNGENYLFGKEIEAYKKSLHQAVIFNEFDETARTTLGIDQFKDEYSILDRRLFLRNRICVLNKDKPRGELQHLQQLQQLQHLQQLQRLERLEQLEQLEQLERLHQLHFHNTSYENIEIKQNSTIYCDIPYIGTGEYDSNKSFNRARFMEWANEIQEPLFISEYQFKNDNFRQIWCKKIKSSMTPTGVTDATEKLFCNKIAYKLLIERAKQNKVK